MTARQGTLAQFSWSPYGCSCPVAVLGVVAFAINHPEAAAAIAGVLLVVGLVGLYLLAKVVRRGWRR